MVDLSRVPIVGLADSDSLFNIFTDMNVLWSSRQLEVDGYLLGVVFARGSQTVLERKKNRDVYQRIS